MLSFPPGGGTCLGPGGVWTPACFSVSTRHKQPGDPTESGVVPLRRAALAKLPVSPHLHISVPERPLGPVHLSGVGGGAAAEDDMARLYLHTVGFGFCRPSFLPPLLGGVFGVTYDTVFKPVAWIW